MSNYDFDFFVIGAGSGGVRAARLAAAAGKRVGIAEEYRYGGTCVIRGCVPKKLMVYASHFQDSFEDASGFGWQVGQTRFDWQQFMASKNDEIARLENIYRTNLEKVGVALFKNRAVLIGNHEVELVGSGKTFSAEKILVAVGGKPSMLEEIPGHEHFIDSNHIFELESQPDEIVIFGGGYIALEFAGIFAGLGTKTTLVYRGDKILRGFDEDIRDGITHAMSARGIEIICNANPTAVTKTDQDKLVVTLDNGKTLSTDKAMLAIGRRPNTDGLGLEAVGVERRWSGHIVVDGYSRSTVPSIFAVGDATDRVALTPVAIHEAMCLFQTEFNDNPQSPDHDTIATAVFSQPEIGTVGLTEAQIEATHANYSVYLAQFRPMKNTLSGRDEKMMMKLIVCDDSGQVLGAHIMGEGAGESAQLLGIMLKAGLTKADFDRTMAVHPTAAEELVTMYEPSFRIVDGQRV